MVYLSGEKSVKLQSSQSVIENPVVMQFVLDSDRSWHKQNI